MANRIRPAHVRDGKPLGRMGAALARLHHELDAPRFMLPEDVEAGYRWWLVKEAKNKRAVVLVAESETEILGYAYGRLEPRDWNALRDRCGGFHDLWVEPAARGQGIGALLAEAMASKLAELGAPRVVLMAASSNAPSQRLFQKLGWRPTMVEMTRETEPTRTPSRINRTRK